MPYKNPVVSLLNDQHKKQSHSDTTLGKKYETINAAYFAFIDVLGFKETYSKNSNFSKVFEYFTSLVDSMHCINNPDNKCYAGQTSDSLYFYTDKLVHLIEFINVFLHFNIYAMSQNVFFRGGIAKGELKYNRPHQFFGDCIIKAYLLEENISKYPRITIDNNTFDDLKKYTPEWTFDKDPHRHFLNPFSTVIFKEISQYFSSPTPPLHTIDINLIKKARIQINKNIKLYEINSATFEKYWYLLDRCDKLLEELKNA